MDIWVNSLWFAALELSMLSALLATMAQVWTRAQRRAQGPTETLEHYALKRLKEYLVIERYSLDNTVTISIALMHMAVILFLTRFTHLLFTMSSTPALVIAVTSGTAGLFYVIASIILLFDPHCPYYTPLSYLLMSVFSHIVLLFGTCLCCTDIGRTSESIAF